jgi:hypothetical protein
MKSTRMRDDENVSRYDWHSHRKKYLEMISWIFLCCKQDPSKQMVFRRKGTATER